MKSFPASILMLYLLLGIFITVLSDTFLYTEDIYYNSISEDLTIERIERILAFKAEYAWLQHIFYVLLECISLTFGALLLCLGCFLFNVKISFNRCLKVYIIGSMAFFLPYLIKILWFALFETDYALSDVRSFYPLSLLAFFDKTSISSWLVYPVYSVSLTRLLYFILLIYAMKRAYHLSYKTSSSLVLSIMGAWWVIWSVFIVFLSVLNS